MLFDEVTIEFLPKSTQHDLIVYAWVKFVVKVVDIGDLDTYLLIILSMHDM